jgi:acyl-CoA thioester hydrolase
MRAGITSKFSWGRVECAVGLHYRGMMTDLPSIGRIVDREHLLPVRVYYEDTDFTGVVYHATYLRYCERGRSEMLRVMGVPPGQPDHGIFAVTRIVMDYRAPARIHDALLVRTAFAGMKGPRLIFRQIIERDGAVLVEAEVVAVAIHPDGRARKPSAAELTHWAAYAPPSLNSP